MAQQRPGLPVARERFFDLSLDMLCVASTEGYFLQLNPRWERTLGWSEAELKARPFLEFVHPDDIDATVEETKKLQLGEDTVSFENRYRHRDGSYRWLRWTSSFADGMFWAVARDVTAERVAQDVLAVSEARFRSIFEEGPIAFSLVRSDGSFAEVNEVMARLVGHSRDELLTKGISDITHPEDLARDIAYLDRVFSGETDTIDIEKRFLGADGSIIWAKVTTARLDEGESEPLALRIIEDITARKEAEAALEQAHDKLESWVGELELRNREVTLINELGDMLQSCRSSGEVNQVLTKFMRRLFPAESGSVGLIANSRNIVETVAAWGTAKVGDDVFAPDACWALRRGRTHQVEDPAVGMICPHLGDLTSTICVPMMAQGEALGLLTVTSHGQPAFVKGRPAEARLSLTVSLAEHIALALANFKLRETLRGQSIRDPLTGLFNRRYVQETLDRDIRRAERAHGSLAVVSADLDHFKHINDTYGHDAGDAVLREVGALLQRFVRDEDIAARFGGEEFLLVLTDASAEVAMKRAAEILEEVRGLDIRYRGTPLSMLTISMGIAMFPTHGASVETLLRRADEALYAAKDQGRDRVILASAPGEDER